MAYYFLTASKDATVYLQQPNQNTGLDEILEVSKVFYGNVRDKSRALLKFDVGYVSQSFSSSLIGLSEATLVLKETESNEIPLEYTLYAHPISQSWEMGNGTRFDGVSTQGVTWNFREGDSNLKWLPMDQFTAGSTGSYSGYGGVWYTSYGSTQSYNYETADANINVISMLRAWISGSIQNNGLIIKHSADFEQNELDYGIIRFFSKETNTIYQPKIRIGWDDQSFVTASLLPLTSENIKVTVSNFKKEYKLGTIPKIKVFGRELYPLKTFSNEFEYNTIKYLPKTTYYQIKDINSDDIIVPFSDYSKISCDSDGNYIKLNLSNWEADRVYKIEFKVDMDGSIQYFDEDITFSIVKN